MTLIPFQTIKKWWDFWQRHAVASWHYGLKRDIIDNKLEKYNQSHSWNSRHSIADWSTFNLGLHSEHHSIANKEYPLLSHDEKPKEMPANYPTMILMALIPPIWFMVMDKKLNLRN